MSFVKIPTTRAVYRAIYAEHMQKLSPFGVISEPCGSHHGDPNRARMYTEWGFRDCDFPIIAAETVWYYNPEAPAERNGVEEKFWLCIGVENSDE